MAEATNDSHHKNIFIINGSASSVSSNSVIIEELSKLLNLKFSVKVFHELKSLPHFDPELSIENTPGPIRNFRDQIENADGVIICTPEYIFSIPSGLKNALEWCVATTIFSDKPTCIVTASASGSQGHEQLQLIMKTIMASVTDETALLIPGIKGKINQENRIIDSALLVKLKNLAEAFAETVIKS